MSDVHKSGHKTSIDQLYESMNENNEDDRR